MVNLAEKRKRKRKKYCWKESEKENTKVITVMIANMYIKANEMKE